MINIVHLYESDLNIHDAHCTSEPRCDKTGLRDSDQVRHKPGCTATEDGWRLETIYSI